MKQPIQNAKRGLSLLLCLALLLAALSLGGVSAKAKACTCNEIPMVSIAGIGDTLYRGAGTPEQEEVHVAETANLPGALLPMALNLVKAVALWDWDAGADAISAVAYSLLGHLQCDEKGRSIEPISSPYIPPSPEQNHKTDQTYGFRYDWRLDPMQVARELDKYIKLVQAATGHSKVAVRYHSEGGLVVTAYLAQFGSAAIDHLIPIASAHNGLTLLGELFNKNVQIDAAALANVLRTFIESEGAMGLIGGLTSILEQAGILDALIFALQLVIDNAGDRLFETTLVPLFAQWPALWGFVPDAYYESAKAAMLDKQKHAALIKTIDDYHYKAGVKADELLRKAAKNGTKVSIIACYGYPSMPFFADANLCADGLIDTARESSGATCAPCGQALPQGYTQKKADGHNHISPNGQIDASTCVFPEQTWFLQDMIHFTAGQDALVDFLVHSKTQPTVRSNPKFPQFMTRLPDGTFIPSAQAAQPPAPPTSLFSSVTQLLTNVLLLLVALVTG